MSKHKKRATKKSHSKSKDETVRKLLIIEALLRLVERLLIIISKFIS